MSKLKGYMKSKALILAISLIISMTMWSCTGQSSQQTGQNASVSTSESEQSVERIRELEAQYCKDGINAVSLIQLIATPERFNGKCVRVIGYAKLEFEGDALYLHEEDYKHAITRNALWLTLEGNSFNLEKGEINNTYVIVVGKFNADNTGHGSLFSGAIGNIIRFTRWPNLPPWVKR